MRAVAALVLLVSAAASASPRDEARRHFAEGSRLYRAAEYKGALAEFTAGYLAKPDPTFLFNIGQCDRMLGDLESAVRHYRAFLDQLPAAPNREAVKRFLAETEAALAQQRQAPPPPKESPPPPAPAPPPMVAQPAPPPTAPAPSEPKSVRRRWVLPVALGVTGALVVGAAIAVALIFLLPKDASIPATTAGNVGFLPR
jgi:iron complex outermembrane receptor protein